MDSDIKAGQLIQKKGTPFSVQYIYCSIPLSLHTARAIEFRSRNGTEEILVQKVYVAYEWEAKDDWEPQIK